LPYAPQVQRCDALVRKLDELSAHLRKQGIKEEFPQNALEVNNYIQQIAKERRQSEVAIFDTVEKEI